MENPEETALDRAPINGLMSTLKMEKTVREASDIVLLKFERPANQGEAVKQKRAQYGQVYYDKFAKGDAMTGQEEWAKVVSIAQS